MFITLQEANYAFPNCMVGNVFAPNQEVFSCNRIEYDSYKRLISLSYYMLAETHASQ